MADLACGHVDDDPYASHKDERGEPVCSECCTFCQKHAPQQEEDK